MNIKLKIVNIIQGTVTGSIKLTETDKDGKEVARGGIVVMVQFPDPKEAAKFEHGKDYTVSIQPTK